MKQYQRINNLIGWFIFAIASVVYIVTSEPTASLWDCGEYIATAYKLQVGHPPGAPLFQLTGRFFSLFAFGDTALVARMVNTMSALASSFTILFLFWSITMLAKKILLKNESDFQTKANTLVVMGAGVVGALAYTFSDSFWFSAVEGEVYATSSFFTAIVFWAMLKWETVAHEKYHWRWIILIAYLMGLSIGVHLLNLLTIPALTYIYYFKKYKHTTKGFIITGIISIALLGLVQGFIIPIVVKLAGNFELFFVNVIGLPFHSGTIIYFLTLISGITFGLHYTAKHKKAVANVIILCFTFLLIGYSTFFLLPIRSNANPPIDENNPENALSLLAYLMREQYGDWPIFYGQYYNAPLESRDLDGDGQADSYLDGSPVYSKDDVAGKYIVTDERKDALPNYDARFCTIFPRMWSSQGNHISGYQSWGEVKGTPIEITVPGPNGEPQQKIINKPTFGENLQFFFRYQLGHMYLRYFMWNFVGRQNDRQGFGGPMDGNWLSGIPFIDELRLGPQDNLPATQASNPARNTFFFLPLILGLIGILFQFKADNKGLAVVFFLFLLTGLAINIYLNPVAPQPRERDYAYAGSFYPFCIWIGFSVVAIYDALRKKVNPMFSGVFATVLALLAAPTLMAKEGWDDHDRSGRYAALDFATNYLNSCDQNAIIFTNGDNDTFPLWYAQEVEGIRTDVRVCNLSLLNTDWYIDQMRRKAYDSDAIPFTFTNSQYRQGTRDYVYFIENPNILDVSKPYELKELIDFVKSDDTRAMFRTGRGYVNYFPTKNFKVSVDSAKVIENGTVAPKDAKRILPAIEWKLNSGGVMKNHLMVLDLIANNNWERPVYFAITTGGDSYVGLTDYFQLEGLAYRLVPMKTRSSDGQFGQVNTDVMYDNLMHKFRWGNIQDPQVYLNQDYMRMIMNFRNNFARLANALVAEGDMKRAIEVCDRCLEVMPEEVIPYDYFTLAIGEAYYMAGEMEKANVIANKLMTLYEEELDYFYSFPVNMAPQLKTEKQQALAVIQRIAQVTRRYGQEELAASSYESLKKYMDLFQAEGGLN